MGRKGVGVELLPEYFAKVQEHFTQQEFAHNELHLFAEH
jgi:hypothetical protein